MELNSKQLEEFRKNGFLLIRGFYDAKKCDAIKDVAKVHLKYAVEPIETEYEYIGIDKAEYKQSIRRLRQVYDRDILFKNWMRYSEIKPILKQVLNEEPVLVTAHHNSIMTKLPHTSTNTEWHRDRRYWHYDSGNLVSVWLALGNEDKNNGVLEFIPKSHKMDLSEESFDDKSFFRADYECNRELVDTKVSFKLNKGDVVLFHAELLHRADENITDEAKISFVYTVKGASVNAIDGTRSAKFKEIEL